MRTQLASGSMIEAAVTLAAAALMTVAGFAMVDDVVPANARAQALAACTATAGPTG